MSVNDLFLGVVREGKFRGLSPRTSSDDLTTIQMQEARPPESGQIDLGPYEGHAIMVQGHDGGGWIYSASVIDHAGPIVTALVQKVFREEDQVAEEKRS